MQVNIKTKWAPLFWAFLFIGVTVGAQPNASVQVDSLKSLLANPASHDTTKVQVLVKLSQLAKLEGDTSLIQTYMAQAEQIAKQYGDPNLLIFLYDKWSRMGVGERQLSSICEAARTLAHSLPQISDGHIKHFLNIAIILEFTEKSMFRHENPFKKPLFV